MAMLKGPGENTVTSQYTLLVQDEGLMMVINGHEQVFRGTLTVATADNLASQYLGGYKSLASALCKCRFCMAVEADMKSKVCVRDFNF